MSESDVLSETIPESQELSDDNINDLNNDEIKDNNTLLEDFLYDAELDTDEEVDVKEASIEAIRSEINKKQRESKLDLILDENYKLLTLMKESNITLYEHSLYLSKLSCEIAELIGGNVPIVKAGALYHEVGKLYSKEYIQESVNTAIINEFPREVTDIIRQYSLTIEVPKSVEAAIIMLTDSAISTIEYVKSRTDKKAAPMNRIIDSVLNARISQNALDESGLNMEQLKTIRGFLIEEFTKVE